MSRIRPVQHFSLEYIQRCRSFSNEQLLDFVESSRKLYFDAVTESKSVLISLKIKDDLLNNFKMKATSEGMKYQTLIKNLMREYLEK